MAGRENSEGQTPHSTRAFITRRGEERRFQRTISEELLVRELNRFSEKQFRDLSTEDEIQSALGSRAVVIFDTEYTTWKGALDRNWNFPGEHREIFALSARKYDLWNDREIDHQLRFIKPIINPTLSSYATQLTGITNKTLGQHGVSFAKAMTDLFAFSESGTLPLVSYGNDGSVLSENAFIQSILLPPFSKGIYNVRPYVQRMGINTDRLTSGMLAEALQLDLNNQAHDPSYDTLSLAISLSALLRSH